MSALQHKLDQARRQGEKLFALLLDPDKIAATGINKHIQLIEAANPDLIFVGGSLMTGNYFNQILDKIKSDLTIPVVLFPGNNHQISSRANAILLLSLISGRNPEWLIGQHVQASFMLRDSGLEILPTGYILIDGGRQTSVSYISNTTPIPADKADIAAATALAGQQLGLRNIYLEAGSGALQPVNSKVIEKVRNTIQLPLIVGGGIRNAEQVVAASKSGADIIVVGTAIEKDSRLLEEMVSALRKG